MASQRVLRLLKGSPALARRLEGKNFTEREAWKQAILFEYENGNMRACGDVLGAMRRARVPVPVVVYNILIKGWREAGNKKFGDTLLLSMIQQGLKPTVRTLEACLVQEPFERLPIVIKRFELEHNVTCDIKSLAKLLTQCDTVHQIYEVLQWRVDLSVVADPPFWNSAITAFKKQMFLKGVQEVWGMFCTDLLQPTLITGALCLTGVRDAIKAGILTNDEIESYVTFCEEVHSKCCNASSMTLHELLMTVYALSYKRDKAAAHYYAVTDAMGFLPTPPFTRFYTYARNPALIPASQAPKIPLMLRRGGKVLKRTPDAHSTPSATARATAADSISQFSLQRPYLRRSRF